MSVKNTLDGSFPIAINSENVPITLTYSGLITATYPSIYTKIGSMCILYLPSLNQTPSALTPSPILITIPDEIIPVQSQNIRGISVNDANGTQITLLQLVSGSNVFTLGLDDGTIPPDGFSNISPVSITRFMYIIYEVNIS